MTPIEAASQFAARLNITLGEKELEQLSRIFIRTKVAKGETILDQGQVARDMLFVEQGLIRQYYFKNGVDITEHFSTEHDIVYCFESMTQRTPTTLMIEALESGCVHRIPYEEFMQLCQESQPIMALYCTLLEDGLLESLRKCDVQRFENARERYETFVRQYPEAARRAPGKHIASYLLMTPESLSRVRAGLL